MEMIEKFGLEAHLFLFQVINFLIIIGLLTKFLYKPIKNMLDERKKKIDQSLLDADNAKIALESAGEERKKILDEAKKDADSLTDSIKVQMQETKEKFTEAAKLSSQAIIEEAKQKAAVEFESVSKQIGKMSIDISGKIISKVFSDLFSEDDKQKLLSLALSKVEKVEYEKIAN
ncbi:MAG: ATP synthase F0 subunit B [Elusimicrobiota bacterium]|jgi:F-type H+-transporting ATPase subunit b|nr:ATP synthase F0 subunit B [Elusimicrobiota bacterium]